MGRRINGNLRIPAPADGLPPCARHAPPDHAHWCPKPPASVKPSVRAILAWDELSAAAGQLPVGEARRLHGLLEQGGIDSFLDDPALRSLMRNRAPLAISLPLFLYVVVREALCEADVEDMEIADYVAAVLLDAVDAPTTLSTLLDGDSFAERLLLLPGDEPIRASTQERVRIAETLLCLVGPWHVRLRARAERRGTPPLTYFEGLARTLFLDAGHNPSNALSAVHLGTGIQIRPIRVALNDVGDRFFPLPGDSVDRLLRRTLEVLGP
jgi:hypothetical protein